MLLSTTQGASFTDVCVLRQQRACVWRFSRVLFMSVFLFIEVRSKSQFDLRVLHATERTAGVNPARARFFLHRIRFIEFEGNERGMRESTTRTTGSRRMRRHKGCRDGLELLHELYLATMPISCQVRHLNIPARSKKNIASSLTPFQSPCIIKTVPDSERESFRKGFCN